MSIFHFLSAKVTILSEILIFFGKLCTFFFNIYTFLYKILSFIPNDWVSLQAGFNYHADLLVDVVAHSEKK